ncbi:MAG: guanylate kinase [Actinomycetia bacterium]|nr:guanylate kinase [Actinomycetes bacterium]
MTGKLFVVSGPSGAGKGTLLAQIVGELEGLRIAVSATTRRPRKGERDGVQYYFLSEEKFEELVVMDGLLEWASVHGARYGTLKAEVLSQLADGLNVILEIDPQGAQQIRQQYPQALLVFIAPPSLLDLEARLVARATESPTQIAGRLETARLEMASQGEYDKVIINDDVGEAAAALAAYIRQQQEES